MSNLNLRVPRTKTPVRLDAFLNENVRHLSRRTAKSAILAGNVFVDGKRTKAPGLALEGGMAVQLYRSLEERAQIEGMAGLDSILFEDAYLLVVDKPSGVAVQSHHDYDRGSLLDRLETMVALRARLRRRVSLGIPFRLDRDTSGLMILTKTKVAYRALREQLRLGVLDRKLLAIVGGNLPNGQSGTTRDSLGWNPRRQRRDVTPSGGRRAETHFRVLQVFQEASLIEVEPRTPFPDQIQLQLAQLGHPILGDPLYADYDSARLGRLALHAHEVQFQHPLSGRRLRFESPLPRELSNTITALGGPRENEEVSPGGREER